MRRSAVVALLSGLALVLAGGAAAASSGPGDSAVIIRKVDVSSFPTVAITVAAGSAATLGRSDFRLSESDGQVSAFTVRTLADTGQAVDVVLAVDTSRSMRGAPLRSALAAARTFVGSLPPSASVGVVMFAHEPVVAEPITADHDAALRQLERTHATTGTAMYDAVSAATSLFSGDGQRTIILLSDGADTGSHLTLEQAAATAGRAGAAVFTVGLAGSNSDFAALERLATLTGGRYAPSASADLQGLYGDLATLLSHQYVLTYRSHAIAGTTLSVSVETTGGGDGAVVLVPRSTRPPQLLPELAPVGRPFLHGSALLAVGLVMAFGASFLLLVALFGSGASRRRRRELARRLGVRPEEETARPSLGMVAWLPRPVVSAGERVAEAGGFSRSIDAKLERAGLPLRAGEFVAGTGFAALLGGLVGVTLLRNVPFALILAVLAGSVPYFLVTVAVTHRTDRLHGQLSDILMILASSLRAGHSFLQALDMAAREIGEPAASEFGRAVAEIRLGRPVEEALNTMAERMASDDFAWAVMAVNIQREVGGNLAEVLDTLAEVVRERNTIRRQVKVLSAEGRLSIGILVVLPILIGLYMAVVNPTYLGLLFTTQLGLVMVVVAGALMVLGIIWMRKVVRIRV